MKITLPVLYKYSTTGKVQQWTITADGDEFYSEEGLVGGKLTKATPTICKGKNIGRSNETTADEQALKEAQAKWQKKVDKGYNEVLSEDKKFFEPMLAHTYQKGILDFAERVFVQPKLDGLRCINDGGKLMSRNGKEYISCPHLHQGAFQLDGELYNHEFKEDFNKIVSLVRKQNPTVEELVETSEKVQYWVYDFPEIGGLFSSRHNALKMFFKANTNPAMVMVPTYEVKNEQEIDEWNEKFLEMGYEGTIIRIDREYESKRSKSLLKYKAWVDEEFEIIGYEEGKGGRTGTIGKFFMKHDKDERANFDCNVKGDFEYLREVWKDRDTYVGKTATVKYFNRTPIKADGTGDKPRFGYVIKIDREAYE